MMFCSSASHIKIEVTKKKTLFKKTIKNRHLNLKLGKSKVGRMYIILIAFYCCCWNS